MVMVWRLETAYRLIRKRKLLKARDILCSNNLLHGLFVVAVEVKEKVLKQGVMYFENDK